jgi:hypothetical protein
MCEADDLSPDQVLNGFVADLCGLENSHGSDERDLAQRYYDRCYVYRKWLGLKEHKAATNQRGYKQCGHEQQIVMAMVVFVGHLKPKPSGSPEQKR